MIRQRSFSLLRSLTEDDLNLIVRAQKASAHEPDAMTADQIQMAFRAGFIGGVTLQTQNARTTVCWQLAGPAALLTCFSREGSPQGFLGDCRKLLIRVEDILGGLGVKTLLVGVHIDNERFTRLLRLFKRMDFKSDSVRLAKRI